jgi:hypothetical protein
MAQSSTHRFNKKKIHPSPFLNPVPWSKKIRCSVEADLTGELFPQGERVRKKKHFHDATAFRFQER